MKVTRQEDKGEQVSSSRDNKLRLEAKFRVALRHMYEAFEEAYTLEQPELIEDLREHLVKPAIAQITGLFASSRCRTCYSGRHQSAVWRLSRFDTLVPIMSEVPNEAYRKAEDQQAVTILDKTRIPDDGPYSDQYKLGLSDDDKNSVQRSHPIGTRCFLQGSQRTGQQSFPHSDVQKMGCSKGFSTFS